MASKNNPTSSAGLIRRHSKARVFHASIKQFPFYLGSSRQLTDADVRESLVRQHR